MRPVTLHNLRADAYFCWPDEPACVGCRYYRPIHDHFDGRENPGRICHYLLDTGRRRSSPFGKGCSCYRS
jgi:hypothetical protein